MMRLLAALTTFLFLCAWAGPAPAGDVWTVTALDWPPYSGPNLPDQGTAIAALRRTLAAGDIELRVIFLPWARAKMEAAEHDYAGYCPAWPEEVAPGFTASPPIGFSRIAVVARDRSPSFSDLDDLFARHSVGLVKTYVYPEPIATSAAAHPGQAVWVPDERALARMLFSARFDAAVTDPEVMRHTAREEGLGAVAVLLELDVKPLVLALRDNELGRERLELLRRLLSGDVDPAPEP
jgi:hypothetical protein